MVWNVEAARTVASACEFPWSSFVHCSAAGNVPIRASTDPIPSHKTSAPAPTSDHRLVRYVTTAPSFGTRMPLSVLSLAANLSDSCLQTAVAIASPRTTVGAVRLLQGGDRDARSCLPSIHGVRGIVGQIGGLTGADRRSTLQSAAASHPVLWAREILVLRSSGCHAPEEAGGHWPWRPLSVHSPAHQWDFEVIWG